jgi:hypothetical protein
VELKFWLSLFIAAPCTKLCFSLLSPSKHPIFLCGKRFANRVNILTAVCHVVAHIGAPGDAGGVCCILHH